MMLQIVKKSWLTLGIFRWASINIAPNVITRIVDMFSVTRSAADLINAMA